MPHWLRYEYEGKTGFGTLEDSTISVFSGDMFASPEPVGETLALSDVHILTPCDPTKMICLWNNFHALAKKLEVAPPSTPLFLFKAPNAFIGDRATIHRPKSYDGPVVFEGELGIVIGKRCSDVPESDIADHIFGYTCINDVTAAKIISEEATFAQWVRAKSFDEFGAFGPVIATEVEPMELDIRTVLNGDERQNYPVSDMFFPPHKLTSLISRDMTLMPGDVIACGTSVGVGSMKEPENTVSVTIEGIGTLTNTFVQ